MMGLYYHVFPQAAATRLAKAQAAIAIIGAVLFPAGIAAGLIGNHDRLVPITAIGSLTAFTGTLLFARIVFRTPAPRRRLIESAAS